jgi:hypothetical protein
MRARIGTNPGEHRRQQNALRHLRIESGSSTRSFDLDTPKAPVALQYLPQLPNGFPLGFDDVT